MIMTLVYEVVAIDHRTTNLNNSQNIKTVGCSASGRYLEPHHQRNVWVFDFDTYRNLTLHLHN